MLLPFCLRAQDKTDSLEAVLATAHSDTARLRILGQLTQANMFTDIAKAEAYGREALKLEEQYPDHPSIGQVHIALGEMLSAKGRYSDQVNHLYIARKIFQKTGDRNGLIGTYNHLAGLFYNLHIYPQALDYWRQALALADAKANTKQRAMILNNIGSLYHETQRLDSAASYYQMAYTLLSDVPGPSRIKSILLSNRAEILVSQQQYERADSFLAASAEIAAAINAPVAWAECLSGRGELKVKQGRPEEAIELFRRSLAKAREVEALPREADAFRGLAEAWVLAGRADSANYYYARYVDTRDSLDRLALFSSISSDLFEREQKIEEERTQMQNELLLRKEREVRIWFIAGLGLLLVTAVFLLLRFLSNRRMARDLELQVKARTAELEMANTELNKFIYQSSHDLRSPLTSILGLADVALGATGKERDYILLMKNRATHLDHAYTSLINTLNIRERELKHTTSNLCDLVTTEAEEVRRLRKNETAVFEVEVSPQCVITTDVYLLGLCLRNLLLNAVDFARTNVPARIRVEGKTGLGMIQIKVTDEGEGIPEDVQPRLAGMFFRASNKSRGTGLGLYNVKLAVEKLGGEMSIQSRPGQGTEVRLSIPLS